MIGIQKGTIILTTTHMLVDILNARRSALPYGKGIRKDSWKMMTDSLSSTLRQTSNTGQNKFKPVVIEIVVAIKETIIDSIIVIILIGII